MEEKVLGIAGVILYGIIVYLVVNPNWIYKLIDKINDKDTEEDVDEKKEDV